MNSPWKEAGFDGDMDSVDVECECGAAINVEDAWELDEDEFVKRTCRSCGRSFEIEIVIQTVRVIEECKIREVTS